MFSNDIEHVSNIYRRERIEEFLDIAEKDLKQVRAFIKACKNQLRKISRTEIKREVYLKHRLNYGTGENTWRVYVWSYPNIPNIPEMERWILGWTEERRTRIFPRVQYAAACEYARNLAKEYGCPIKIKIKNKIKIEGAKQWN